MEEKVDAHEVVVQGSEMLKAAMEKEPPQPRHKRMLQLYAIVTVAFLCSSINGYDGSLMSNMLVMPTFESEFGASIVGIKAGYISAMYTIGGVCALPFVGPASDTWGRRAGMCIGCGFVILGTIIEGTSNISGKLAQFLAGRFFLGFGNSIAASAAPIYVVEISHPAYRGVMTGLYNTIYNVGSIAAAGALRGGENHAGNTAWLIPTWVQMLMPGLVCVLAFWLPESPRWLYCNDRAEAARAVIVRYHGLDREDSAYLHLQLAEYSEGLKLDGADKRWWDYRALFKDRASRYRLMCNLILSVWGQWSGNGFTSYFMPAFLATAGVTNALTVLNINLGTSFSGWFISMAGASYVERIGRRTLFFSVLLGISFWWVMITISAAIFHHTGSKAAGDAAILFVNLFGATYSFGITPLQALYPVEVLSYEQRAKGMAFSSLVVNAASLVNMFAMPVAIERIGWKLYIVFAVWVLVEAAVVYFFLVETRGRTLEELDHIFQSDNPRKASIAKKKLTLDADDNIVEVAEA
ncbi:hypothetical protein ASPZODRAFT_58497 [Penicilliopsis zonata CBS 506.65]|uniref:Major facilitator superfamily (MFS) profile domain-containing protein n=1 Tax=Penicilliopsis zonata CBS 506.65 TaxID=1073090 RepID=A0A1L9ST70_9EURO|nr:hypothetical protein ASPZODRAFT_58497 [Penicilliopsis zonata CBS 506.65]OJJ50293.1 hypothetical protein ASPZODRAFT_58497 [Penicilliopsis zonata CBS 506.65]